MIGWKIYCHGREPRPTWGERWDPGGSSGERFIVCSVTVVIMVIILVRINRIFLDLFPFTSVDTHWPKRLNPKPNDKLKIVTNRQFRTLAMFYPETSF